MSLAGCAESMGWVPPLDERRAAALRVRREAAERAAVREVPAPELNGDERRHPHFLACFSKGLPHDELGRVDPEAYGALLQAVRVGEVAAFDAVPCAGPLRLVNPVAGQTFALAGPDPAACWSPAPPAFASAEQAAEMAELYWMAMLRDVGFDEYDRHALVDDAVDDLGRFSDYRGATGRRLTSSTLFRGSALGESEGPFVSQFLWREFMRGARPVSQRQLTFAPGEDFATDFDEWLALQNGQPPSLLVRMDSELRYIRTLRDLSACVKSSSPMELFLDACAMLLAMQAPWKQGVDVYRDSPSQTGFATFGAPHLQSLLGEVCERALCAVWFQKWFLHRRLRPEEFGGRVDVHVRGRMEHPLHEHLLASHALAEVQRRFGSALLPLAWPEGCPAHPSYGGGHSAMAGACATVLKAWFDEAFVMPEPVVPNEDGTALLPYIRFDARWLNVGGELNKLASNIAMGHCAAGAHWRSDHAAGMRLGEMVALWMLAELKLTLPEPHAFTLTTFDGVRVTV
jgi:hypothetical protein